MPFRRCRRYNGFCRHRRRELMVPGTTLAYTEAHLRAGVRVFQLGVLSILEIASTRGNCWRQSMLLTWTKGRSGRFVASAERNRHSLRWQAQLHLQALNRERYKVLVAKGVFSRQQGDQQEADFRVADANVQRGAEYCASESGQSRAARVLQQYEHVTAPFSGIITARNVDVGILITTSGSGWSPIRASQFGLTFPGSRETTGLSPAPFVQRSPATGGSQGGAMFTHRGIDPLAYLVSVPEAYAALIHLGTKRSFSCKNSAADLFTGHVTRTSASIDLNTRTLLVELQVAIPAEN